MLLVNEFEDYVKALLAVQEFDYCNSVGDDELIRIVTAITGELLVVK